MQQKKTLVVPLLLGWFAKNARNLAWRRTRAPYAIWVSEIMLQQTQVKTVIPYWERWMQSFPSISVLAKAKPQKVLKLWEGLGYYTRARNMHKAAQLIVDRHRGNFPERFDEVLELPGVGRYTAGAICSIAYNQPTPVLDGNVIRVLTRLFGIQGNPRERTVNEHLWGLAEGLVSCAAAEAARGCSHLNQALMELGAIVCTPAQPKCPVCPVRGQCVAHSTGSAHKFPNLPRRASATQRRFAAFVIESRGKFFVRQRPLGVVNAGLWEFPNVEMLPKSLSVQQAARKVFEKSLNWFQLLGVLKHTITRYRITLEVYHACVSGTLVNRLSAGRWLTAAQARRLPFTSAHRKIWKLLAFGGVPPHAGL